MIQISFFKISINLLRYLFLSDIIVQTLNFRYQPLLKYMQPFASKTNPIIRDYSVFDETQTSRYRVFIIGAKNDNSSYRYYIFMLM